MRSVHVRPGTRPGVDGGVVRSADSRGRANIERESKSPTDYSRAVRGSVTGAGQLDMTVTKKTGRFDRKHQRVSKKSKRGQRATVQSYGFHAL